MPKPTPKAHLHVLRRQQPRGRPLDEGVRPPRATSPAVEGQQVQGFRVDRRVPCRNHLPCTPPRHVSPGRLRHLRRAAAPHIPEHIINHAAKVVSDACCIYEATTAAFQKAIGRMSMAGAGAT